jgi:hypothetical protein
MKARLQCTSDHVPAPAVVAAAMDERAPRHYRSRHDGVAGFRICKSSLPDQPMTRSSHFQSASADGCMLGNIHRFYLISVITNARTQNGTKQLH